MEELNCAVTSDLLPLYMEDLVSPETRGLVARHLEGCPACREKLARMETEVPGVAEENLKQAAPLKRVYWHLVLIILSFPIWFPLLLTLAAVVFTLYLCLWVVLLCLWCVPLSFACAAVAAPLAGWMSVGAGGVSILSWAAGGAVGWVVRIGVLLACGGLAVLSGYGCWWLTRQTLGFSRWLFRRLWGLVTGKKENK